MKACEKYQELMSRQIDGDLTVEENAALMSHLDECVHCSAQYEVFQMMCQALSGMEAEPPEGFAQEILSKVALSKKKSFFRRYGAGAFAGIAAVAAALVLVFSGNLNMILPTGMQASSAKAGALQTESLKKAADSEPTIAAPEAAAAGQEDAPQDSALLTGGAESGAGESSMMMRSQVASDSPLQTAQASAQPKAEEAQPADGANASDDSGAGDTADDDAQGGGGGVRGLLATVPQAPELPFSGMFSVIVTMTNPDMEQFSQYEQDTLEGKTYVFIPSDALEAILAAQTDETAEYTVYRTGSSIDPEAEDGLVIVSE